MSFACDRRAQTRNAGALDHICPALGAPGEHAAANFLAPGCSARGALRTTVAIDRISTAPASDAQLVDETMGAAWKGEGDGEGGGDEAEKGGAAPCCHRCQVGTISASEATRRRSPTPVSRPGWHRVAHALTKQWAAATRSALSRRLNAFSRWRSPTGTYAVNTQCDVLSLANGRYQNVSRALTCLLRARN